MSGDAGPDVAASAVDGGSTTRREVPGLTPLTVEPLDGPAEAPPASAPEPQPAMAARAAEDLDARPLESGEPPTGPGARHADGDDLWAPTFGAINAPEDQGVIAVHRDEVYIGGDFWQQMAGLPQFTYLRVAHWNGSTWRRMGDGVDGRVRAIAVLGDDVYVGGEFTTVANGIVEASRLARWDGTVWSAVAGGVDVSQAMEGVVVRALACDGEKLYVAGTFEVAGTGDGAIAANGFAALDLSTGLWETYGGGLGWLGVAGAGHALTLAGDRLYIGGSFDHAGALETTSFAALDLTSKEWEGFDGGVRQGDLPGTVDSLAVDETTGTVYAGGQFTTAGAVTASGVAALVDREFASLGGFRFGESPEGANVRALAHTGGRLYAAGVFTHVDDVEVNGWAVRDGGVWTTPAPLDNEVHALAAHGDGVVVTGSFTSSGDVRVPHAGIWTGAGWRTFGQGLAHEERGLGFVHGLAATETGGVYAGGFFDQAGPVRAGSVAEWREDTWHDLAGGVQMPATLGTVFAMLLVGTDLYVTGSFESAGGAPAAGIARWDGARWFPLGSGLVGAGLALTTLGGRLYVGGSFSHAGDVFSPNLAAWDLKTQTWSAVGSSPAYDKPVRALAPLLDRYLVVGGEFDVLWSGHFKASGQHGLVLFDTHAPPDPANPVAGYSRIPGVTFSWMPGVVNALHVLGNDLYVGGLFQRAGVTVDPPDDGFEASNLAVWRDFDSQDAGWSTPGGTDFQVTSFATLDGRALVIGGWFDHAGAVAASGVVEHDPETGSWTPYASGIGWGAHNGPTVRTLAQSSADGLWVGGTFTVAGGVPSANLALWRGTTGRQSSSAARKDRIVSKGH